MAAAGPRIAPPVLRARRQMKDPKLHAAEAHQLKPRLLQAQPAEAVRPRPRPLSTMKKHHRHTESCLATERLKSSLWIIITST